ncbi:lycopene cyclase family protein [Aliiglaciecola sp.]|nr:lycopene cyclase family protein [Aliiglaciecola sp.]
MTETDLVIIGAGASGLLLLQELHHHKFCGSVTILERKAASNDDRIWSFWDYHQLPDYLRENVDYQWPKWRFSSAAGQREMHEPTQPYCSLRSGTLRSLTDDMVNKLPSFSIIYDCIVDQIEQYQGKSVLTTSKGQWSTPQIIDTRPPPLHHRHFGLFQCFLGIEVETEKDAFDPSSADLMDDIKNTEQGLEFVYVLPFSKRHALIELTYFSAAPIVPKTLEPRLQSIINQRLHSQSFKPVREEMGTLPMYSIDLNRANANSAHLYGGIAGGAMRASTGYSFLNSQRWANDLAQQIVNHRQIHHQRPIARTYRMLDLLFLRVLRTTPELGVSLYTRMFQALEAKTFIHFMSERASLSEIAQVVWAMPKRLFLLKLVKSYLKSNRSTDE